MNIIITGAKRVGTYIGKKLLEEGHKVAIVYNKTNVCEDIKGAFCIKRDLSKEDVSDIPNVVYEKLGSIDGFLHLASPYYKTPIDNFDIKDYEYYNKIIVESFLNISIGAFKIMMKNEGKTKGHIIGFGDWALDTPYKDYMPYFVAKGGLHSAVKVLAKEFAPHVLVNALALGPVLMPEDMDKTSWDNIIKNTPLQQEVNLEDIYNCVKILLTTSSMTGTIIPVDGGRHIKGVSS